MALTSGGSVNPTPSAANGAAQRVSPPGVTRAGRLANESVEAATGNGVPGSQAPSEAFMDGNTLPRLDSDVRPDVRQTAQLNGGDTGFVKPQTNASAAPIVNRQAGVDGGQPSGAADATSEAYSHGSSAGFPFQVPPARKL